MSSPLIGNIQPSPTDEEAAAVATAIELLWPQAVTGSEESASSQWRFKWRWWTQSPSWPQRSY